MTRIALKIDVDTYRGTLNGVPALIELLNKYQARASFFFTLGRDRSGKEAAASTVRRHYDLATRLYGKLLPAPQIGGRGAAMIRQARDAGFEVGLRGWDRVRWEQRIAEADNPWVEGELARAILRFSEICGENPKAHAAPGWKMNRHALRLTQRLGFAYASDCRGHTPFLPVIDGELVNCPQLPTTLPTLDELLAEDRGLTAEAAADQLAACAEATPGDHVFTLRAELEGMKFRPAFERLLGLWQANGVELVDLGDLYGTLDLKSLPRHPLVFERLPGKLGTRLVQGPEFLADLAAA